MQNNVNRFEHETTNWLSVEVINEIVQILDNIPKEYMRIQEDCNRKDIFYCSDEVVQIRPSTHPLFLLKNLGLVVKVLYDKEKIENEKRARGVLKNTFNLVPMEFACYDNGFLEIMPYLEDSLMLSELSRSSLSDFVQIYDETSTKIYQYILHNKRSFMKNEKVIFAGRSIECMNQWTNELVDVMAGVQLLSYNTGIEYNISGVLKKVLDELSNNTRNTCVFSGDINCHNILYNKKDIFLIDFEYWGNFDVEYLVSVLLGSLFLHCDLYEDCYVETEKTVIKIKYGLKANLSEIKSLRVVQELCVNNERVKAFILARMYYKFLEIKEKTRNSKNVIVVCAILDYFSKIY